VLVLFIIGATTHGFDCPFGFILVDQFVLPLSPTQLNTPYGIIIGARYGLSVTIVISNHSILELTLVTLIDSGTINKL